MWRWWDRIQAIFLNLFYFSKISTVHNRGNKLLKHNYRTRCIRPRGSYYANAIENYGDDSIFYFIKPRGLKFKRRGVYSNAGSNTYLLFSIPKQKWWIAICREIICENMQIQEKCAIDAMVLFDKFFLSQIGWWEPDRAGSQWPEVSVNPKENRLFRRDGSYLLALLYSWPVWYQPNHRVLTKGVWQPLRIVELNPKVTNNVWIPPWASHC